MATEYEIVTLIQKPQPQENGQFEHIHWERDKVIAGMLQNGYKPEQITTTSGENGMITLTIVFSRHKQTVALPVSDPDQATAARFAEKASRGY